MVERKASCRLSTTSTTPTPTPTPPASSFVQMIKKKFRFLTNSTTSGGGSQENNSSGSSKNSSRDETLADDTEKTNSIDFRTKQSLMAMRQASSEPLANPVLAAVNNNNNSNIMHRSITDTINTTASSSYMNVMNASHYAQQMQQQQQHPNQHQSTLMTNNTSSLANVSMSTLRDRETPNSTHYQGHYQYHHGGMLPVQPSYRRMSITAAVSSTANDNDDVAHIFNRNSLNDCLYPPSSRRSVAAISTTASLSPCQRADYVCGVGGSYRMFVTGAAAPSTPSIISTHKQQPAPPMMMMIPNLNDQPKRPSCLQLNNQFKKETSI